MSSGVFIDKEFSNRIELSRLDQDILKFHCFGCYPPWGVGGWVDGGVGGWGQPPHTRAHARTHTHARARTHMYAYRHDNFMQMAAPIGISHWEFPMMSYACACACMRVHACMRACVCMGVAHTHPHPHPPTHPPGGAPPNQ